MAGWIEQSDAGATGAEDKKAEWLQSRLACRCMLCRALGEAASVAAGGGRLAGPAAGGGDVPSKWIRDVVIRQIGARCAGGRCARAGPAGAI